MSFFFPIPTLQRRSLFCFQYLPFKWKKESCGLLGFVFPSSFHPSVASYNCFSWIFVMFAGFHFCCCLHLTKRNAQRSCFFFFLISNTYSSKSKNNGSGLLGCVSSSSFHLSGSPKNCLVVFVLPSFHPSLSPQNCCWNCSCVVVGARGWPQKLVTGHKISSQSWTRKKQTNEFWSPSFKTFPLQTETKTKWALSSCVYILISFISLPPKAFIVVFELSSFHPYLSPETGFVHFVLSSLHATPPTKAYFVVLVLLLFSSVFSLLVLLLWMVSKYTIALGRKKPWKL